MSCLITRMNCTVFKGLLLFNVFVLINVINHFDINELLDIVYKHSIMNSLQI